MKWEDVMRNKDKKAATQLVDDLAKHRRQYGEDFEGFAKIIDYPKNNVWREGKLSSHFNRILVELKILSLTGKTLFEV